MLYRRLLRPLLFLLGAEQAHTLSLGGLKILAKSPTLCRIIRRLNGADATILGRTVFGLRFPSPFGLAGGMDKDGRAVAAWAALGFGFVEVGTVTRHPQEGNERPRLYRIRQHEAIINRMGFNNAGSIGLARRLSALRWRPFPIGVSLGKSKITPVEQAANDYVFSLRVLRPYADYFAINVSSPNTPGLRGLQDRAALDELLSALQDENRSLPGAPPPLLVKLAPDLSNDAIIETLDVCAQNDIAGIIAVNTTLDRSDLEGVSPRLARQPGGLSGRPLHRRALEVVELIHRETNGKLPIIGVGGVHGPEGFERMQAAGASLVQSYSGLVYQGPGLVRQINRSIKQRAKYGK